MAAAFTPISSMSQEEKNQLYVDCQARDYFLENRDYFLENKDSTVRDKNLKTLASKVSLAFINARFYSMCCENFTSSLEIMVKKNRNFIRIDNREILRSVGALTEKKQKNLLRLIAGKLTQNEMRDTLDQLLNEANNVATANNDNEMLEWLKLLPGLAYSDVNEGLAGWLKPLEECNIM